MSGGDEREGLDQGGRAGHLRAIGQALAVALAYFVAGRLALLMAIPPGYATAVWPAAGIALVAVLLCGWRACPGIALGSFFVNVGTSFDSSSTAAIITSLGIAASLGAGAALQGAAGALLIRRFVGYPTALDRQRDVALLLVLGGPVSCLVNATWGVATLLVAGLVSPSMYGYSWWTWWVGDAIGVVIFAPLVLTFVGQPRDGWRRRRATVALPLAIGFAVVTALFVRASAWEQAQHDAAFARRAGYLANALQRRIGEYVEAVESVADLFRAHETVTRAEFRAFTRGALARHGGIQALSWNPRVPASERGALEEAARRDGLAGFELKAAAPSGALVRAPAWAEHVPVYYIEPLGGNAPALGFDLASNPLRLASLDQARDGGSARATAPIRLVQEPERQVGLLLLVPVYRAGHPAETVAHRRAALRGFAVGVFRAGDVVEEALTGLDRDGMTVRVVDEAAPGGEGLLHGAPAPEQAGAPSGTGWSTAFEVAGRSWRVTFSPTAAFLAARRTWQAWLVFAGGLFFVGLLGTVLLVITGREARIAAAAEGLRRREARKAAVLNSSLDAIVSMDHLGNVVEFNAAAERMFGYRRAEVLGKVMADLIIPPSLREAHRRGLARFLKTGDAPVLGRVLEMPARRADGSEFPAELAITRVEGEVPPLFTGFLRDVTERSKAADRAHRLQALTGALARAAAPREVVDVVLREGTAALGAKSGAVLLVSADASHLEVAGAVGYPAAVVERCARVPLEAPLALCDAVRSRCPVVLESLAERRARYPGAPPELDGGAVVALPLLVQDRAIGGIGFHYAEERHFGVDDRQFMDVLADYCAQALERARLFEAEQRARAEAAHHARRVALLAEASKVFAQVALDYDEALATIARHIAETLGDACGISLLSSDRQTLSTAAVYHTIPEARQLVEELAGVPRRVEDVPSGRVVLTGNPLLMPEVDTETLRASVHPSLWPFIERFPVRSALVVPLRVGGRVLGLISMTRHRAGHPYTEEDQQFVQELADRAAMAIENARLLREARAAISLRDEFLSIASHELRTPLTALQLQLESLRNSLLGGEVARDQATRKADLATRQTVRLGRLIDNLLSVSRLSAGRLRLDTEELDLLALAREVAERFEAEAERAGCRLTVRGTGPVTGQWDRLRLEQVVSNLLANAIKYAPNQPIEVVVEGTGRAAARLVVRDHGPGIAQADVDRIFARFEQAVSSRHHGGLGLGLYISRQIVEAHGGAIVVASEPGKGAAFTVSLPVEAQHAQTSSPVTSPEAGT